MSIGPAQATALAIKSWVRLGVRTPTVSTNRTRSAPQLLAAVTKPSRKSSDARLASCAPTDTNGKCPRANATRVCKSPSTRCSSLPKQAIKIGDAGRVGVVLLGQLAIRLLDGIRVPFERRWDQATKPVPSESHRPPFCTLTD